ncbi:substrate-binding domain-containing protein [Bradyrhizobium quebecense]|uniref:Substrate-binding domain-containing protein n=2 Tax=Bradyrhizobium quebecense TaxID=2748629 RepID=A0ACD3V4Q0_9BRAD|nr:substrate-binding domain-containing protein [Bradyrhizobium quebecense]UGY01391.1 substrate-binding domain-containing protein [Bradyrhizobium quebecense]
MKTKSFAERVLGTTSLVVLSAAAMIGAQQPAAAQTGIYGGSTLSSLALRQIFDCYAGATLANDGQAFSPSFSTATPSPNLLPTSCTLVSTSVEGLFAAVGSGNGQRAYNADDARQLFRGSPDSAPAVVRKPSAKPPFRDTANAAFKSYPYPRLDYGASDAPLASSIASLTTISFSNFVPSTNWQSTLLIGALSSSSASFNTSAVGAPIQVPAMEVPVAIAVNTSNSASGVTWTNQSALSPNSQAGGAIQLSAAQLCAIFSATVPDWHDTSTLIPALDANGAQQFQHFYDANTSDTAGTRVPAVKNWLAWFFGGSVTGLPNYNPAASNADNPGYDPNVARVIRNNGFHELDGVWATNILNAYLISSAAGGLPSAIAAYSTSGTQTDGCTGVTGGAK